MAVLASKKVYLIQTKYNELKTKKGLLSLKQLKNKNEVYKGLRCVFYCSFFPYSIVFLKKKTSSITYDFFGEDGENGMKLQWYPKFLIYIILFVGLKTLGTFVKFVILIG